MPIRIEHQPSPYAVGMAGYAAGAGVARQRKQKYALDLFQQDRALREREQDRQQRDQLFYDRDTRTGLRHAALSLPAVPEWVTDADQRKRMMQSRSGLMALADQVDPRSPEQVSQFWETHGKYMGDFGMLKEPDRAEALNKDRVFMDRATGTAYSQPVEGAVPWSISRGAPIIDTRPKEAADKAQQAQAKEAEKAYSAAVKEYRTTVFGYLNAAMKDVPLDDPKREEIRRNNLKRIEDDMAASGWVKPVAPAAAGGAVGGGGIPDAVVGEDGSVIVPDNAAAQAIGTPATAPAPAAGTPSPVAPSPPRGAGTAGGLQDRTPRVGVAGTITDDSGIVAKWFFRPEELVDDDFDVIRKYAPGMTRERFNQRRGVSQSGQANPQTGANAPVVPAGGAAVINEDGVMVGTQPTVSPAPGQATPEAAAALRNPNARIIPIPLAPAPGMPAQPTPGTGAPFEMASVDDFLRASEAAESTTPAGLVQARAAERAAGRRARSGLVHSGPGGAGGRPAPLARTGFTPQRPPQRGTADFIAANVDRNPDADKPLAVNPLAMADLSRFTPEQQARLVMLEGAARKKAEQMLGGSIPTFDELHPELKRPDVQAPRSVLQQHVDAIRGPQGTGEGIARDSDRMVNSIAGVRKPYLPPPDTGGTVTKYKLAGSGGIDEDRFAAAKRNLDERMRLASQERLGESNAAAYRANVEQAFGMGQQVQNQSTVAKAVQITTDAEYNQLPSGTLFRGPDGKLRRKA